MPQLRNAALALLVAFVAAALPTPSLGADTCEQAGWPFQYSCSSYPDGDTEYCSKWEPNSVCYNGKCWKPKGCTPIDKQLASPDGEQCKDTGYVCRGHDEGDKSFCGRWASNSVCYSGKCWTPASCKQATPGSMEASVDEKLAELKAMTAKLEDLVSRLEAPGEDQDNVPEKFSRLVQEMSADNPEPDFAADMDIQDYVNVLRALGYKDTKATSSRKLMAYFDDEINVGGGRSGKAVVQGHTASDSFTLWACFDANNNVPQSARLEFSNEWNENKRLSTSYIDSSDGSFCVQSDQSYTKYDRANVQLAKEQAAVFTVTVQVFHVEVLPVILKYKKEL